MKVLVIAGIMLGLVVGFIFQPGSRLIEWLW